MSIGKYFWEYIGEQFSLSEGVNFSMSEEMTLLFLSSKTQLEEFTEIVVIQKTTGDEDAKAFFW